MPLAGARASASIGIAVHKGSDADFQRMYRDPDAALYQARAEQKTRIGLHIPSNGKSAHSLGAFSAAPQSALGTAAISVSRAV